jgi:hypothetical protein
MNVPRVCAGALVVASKVAADQLTWTVAINSLFFFTTEVRWSFSKPCDGCGSQECDSPPR